MLVLGGDYIMSDSINWDECLKKLTAYDARTSLPGRIMGIYLRDFSSRGRESLSLSSREIFSLGS
jgi:hypothetical protein